MQTSDILAVLDPRTNTTTEIKIPSNGPVLDANTPRIPGVGRREDLEAASRPAQCGDGRQGTRVCHGTDSRSEAAAGVLH